MDDARKISQGQLLTSSRESADPWASRETSVPFDFFDRLALWVTGIFLIEALGAFGDFTAGSASCTGGSSAVISSAPFRVFIITAEKAKGNRFYTTRKEESKHNKIIKFAEHLRCHEVEKF
jgi:hypothetical protein